MGAEMKDLHDKLTGDLITKRGPGRPVTGKALSPAEKQKAYRARRKESGEISVTLTKSEATAIVSLLQDKARDIAIRKLCGGPVEEKELETVRWISNLANKIAVTCY